MRGCYDESEIRSSDDNARSSDALAKSYKSQLDAANQTIIQTKIDDGETISQLRQAFADKPTKFSPAELMGLHDETNYTILTNSISLTNMVERFFYASHPVLDYFQMTRISQKAKSDKPITLFITCGQYDSDSTILAKQIGQVFIASGYNVSLNVNTNEDMLKKFPIGVTIGAKNFPSDPLFAGYKQLCIELNLNGSWDPCPSAKDGDYYMTVNFSH